MDDSRLNDGPDRTIFESIPQSTEQIATEIVDAAFRVHTNLGPGLLESVYEVCLCYELSQRKLSFERQLSLPVVYGGVSIDAGLRIDLLVADCVIVELKAVEKLLPVHEAQVLTYLKLTEKRVGLLINFNVVRIKDGIRRLAR